MLIWYCYLCTAIDTKTREKYLKRCVELILKATLMYAIQCSIGSRPAVDTSALMMIKVTCKQWKRLLIAITIITEWKTEGGGADSTEVLLTLALYELSLYGLESKLRVN